MATMTSFILTVHLMLAITMVAVVLLQRSEGGALGIGGGSGGGGGGLMSGRGTANLLTRVTAVLAAMFMMSSLLLSILASNTGEPRSILDDIEAPSAPVSAPAAPTGPAAPIAD